MSKWITEIQDKLFEVEELEDPLEWQSMPEFKNEKNDAYRKIIISFQNEQDIQDFAKLVNQHITDKTKSLWIPEKRKNDSIMMWIDES